MIISSELTGKQYTSVEECLKDEKKFLDAKKQKEEAEKAHKEELDKAYEEAVAACERYFELAGIKIDIDEDSYTITTKPTKESVFNTLCDLYDLMF